MPVHTYGCKCGAATSHVTEHGQEPPKTKPCRVCEEPALLGVEADTKKGFVTKGSVRCAIHSFKCESCGEVFDATIFHATMKTADGVPCRKCGGHSKWVITGLNVDTSDMRYPYFDRGLGMWIQSKRHRDEVCKEPRRFGINSDGLIPVDGDFDVDKQLSEKVREEERLTKDYDDYADRLEHDPKFRGWRQARDRQQV
jgi:predicted nucleic acid-binding Zn ribbon protein